jgi:hypothetical protein
MGALGSKLSDCLCVAAAAVHAQADVLDAGQGVPAVEGSLAGPDIASTWNVLP